MPKLSKQRRHCRQISSFTYDKNDVVQESSFESEFQDEETYPVSDESGSEQRVNNLAHINSFEADMLNEEIVQEPEISGRKQRVQNISLEVISTSDVVMEDDTYIIIDFTQMQNLLPNVKCGVCNTCSLSFFLKPEKYGLVRTIQLICKFCEESGFSTVINETFTSKRLESTKKCSEFELNLRFSLAITFMGSGYAGMEQFATIMNMDIPSQSNFDIYVKSLHKAGNAAVTKCLEKANSLVKKSYLSDSALQDSDCEGTETSSDVQHTKLLDIAVSFDGSWLTRGHKSKYGLACVIDVNTGYVLDFYVMSKHCQTCIITKNELGEDSPDFALWYSGHQSQCLANHIESSGAMEKSAAEVMWGRSEKSGLRYTEMVSDGDSKAFNHVSELQIYGKDVKIKKVECVNHVKKRWVVSKKILNNLSIYFIVLSLLYIFVFFNLDYGRHWKN